MEGFNNINTPLVSVIVPVYNDSKFLKKCIYSIDNQTYNNIEIILINDGSTDNSQEICENLKNSSARNVVVISQKNQGSSVARNKGLDIANGEYISFVDGDDWLVPKMIEKLVVLLKKNKLKIIEFNHTDTSKPIKQGEIIFVKLEKKQAYQRIIKHHSHAVWKRIYTKDLINDFRFNIGKLHQDYHFTLEMISRIDILGIYTESLYVYNTSSESIVRSKFNEQKIFSMDQILYFNDYRKYFNEKTQILATSNILSRMKYCYHELYMNPEIDPVFTHRRQVQKWFKENYNKDHIKSFNHSLIAICPVKLYKYIYAIKSFYIKQLYN